MGNRLKSFFRRLAEGYEQGWRARCLKPVIRFAAQIYSSVVCSKAEKHAIRGEGRQTLPCPVISVGNLTWGGTGKTPLVEYLTRRFSEQHRRPMVLTRGYNQDEVVQLRHQIPNAVIGVGKNRFEIGSRLAKAEKVDVAILDDGFQHWPLARNLDVVLINALNPFGNEKIIPEGILREPLSALSRAGVLMISNANLVSGEAMKKLKNRLAELAPKAVLVESYLEPLFFYRAKTRDRVLLNKLQNQKVATFSGVGNPISFHRLLSSLEIKPALNFDYTDHHVFTNKEMAEIKEAAASRDLAEIITTEKDFYRCPQLITQTLNPLVLAVRMRIRSGEDALNAKIFGVLGNKSR